MTVQKIKELLDAQVLCGESLLEREVHTACGSDMMSDVLAFVKEQAVLLTQVIRTAEMMDMQCIVFVRGKQPDEDMKALAAERGMVLLSTEYEMFTSCGMLYANGLRGRSGA